MELNQTQDEARYYRRQFTGQSVRAWAAVPGDSTSEHTNKHSLQLENVLTDFFKKNIHPKKYFSQLLP